jgi:outer membrane protein
LHRPHSHKKNRRARLCSVLVPLGACAGTALAADEPLLGDHADLVLGAAAQLAPRYPGAKDGRVLVLPVLSAQRGVLFADTTRGAGVQFQTASGLYGAQSVFYDLGRLQRDSDWRPGSRRLAGMGDLAGSFTTRSLLAQDFGHGLSASAEAELALRDGAHRNRFRLGVELEALKAGQERLVLDLDTHWGDRRYNQAWFGVTSAQAAASGLRPFRADGGLHAASFGATWEHRFDAHWTGSLQASSLRYLGDASRSPLVERRDAVTATVALTYAFSTTVETGSRP